LPLEKSASRLNSRLWGKLNFLGIRGASQKVVAQRPPNPSLDLGKDPLPFRNAQKIPPGAPTPFFKTNSRPSWNPIQSLKWPLLSSKWAHGREITRKSECPSPKPLRLKDWLKGYQEIMFPPNTLLFRVKNFRPLQALIASNPDSSLRNSPANQVLKSCQKIPTWP